MIQIENLRACFGDFRLRNINLTLNEGDYWVCVGPSGAGKSMLLRVLAGFEVSESGQIKIDGRNVIGVPPEKRNIGYIFQKDVLFPHRDVEGNLRFPLEIRGLGKKQIRDRVDEYSSRVKIQPLLRRRVQSLSGGESQRVAIARALIFQPKYLFLDEPLSALDHNSRLELQDELRTLQNTLGFTALHVTHSRAEAFSLATHLAVIRDGKLEQTGTVGAVKQAPEMTFVRRFLGLDTTEAGGDAR